MRIALAVVAMSLPLAACNPNVTIKQDKPMVININFNGHLDLVIHDARQEMEAITGEKPRNTVRPEDIGLPPAAGGATQGVELRHLAEADSMEEPMMAVMLQTGGSAGPKPRAETFYTVATEDELKKSMAARSAQIRALWDSGTIGESHDGTVVARKTLTADQQKLVDAENADRKALYSAEAASKKQKVDDVVLGYYVARLGYAKKGAWYEKKNAAGAWEWVQWSS